MLNNTQLRYYDSNVLRLPADKRKEYHEQVDRLIDELRKTVRDKTEIKITKVVKAGLRQIHDSAEDRCRSGRCRCRFLHFWPRRQQGDAG
ncbi:MULTISPECIES: hypothetical protein [Bradyrhizobium]|uniref:Uncharacterized protein n=1 Tax=Bradyrhizobium zhengyangense TaxID=2911009 RepID=A0A9X1RFW7_9BRAD|nr:MULTISPECIES: hypothetical protein [Bradyrhizobium]MCG2629425.1 hypothetical protein [Bradyrhizobium zhengyangense]MCG2644948.1 hypothetical protein [Bradyrhizobium zhengyangense]MCG2670939.1 hypothetical protein [Bradyrhizobium zhengyangense]MDN4984571.1 hypothetical protein [Bradyrhizobium sp. WYCCWR 13022]MDN5002564.1 hypothetical protein [Bradyrhizobium sp. WYCCWR 12677]